MIGNVEKLLAEWDEDPQCPFGRAGLARRASRRPWSPAELDALRREYPTHGCPHVAELLGRGRSSVYNKAQRLGLYREPEQRSVPLPTVAPPPTAGPSALPH